MREETEATMKFTIDKSELQKGLARIQAIVEKRNSMPILANLLIEASRKGKKAHVQLAATDLEVGVQGLYEASVEAPGGVTASAKKLFEIVRELPNEPIQIATTENEYLDIRCARAKFILAGTAADEYPTLPEFSPGKTARVQAAVISTMIERTMYATSFDETRYNLNGVYFEVLPEDEKIRMVATDGHRLSYVDRSIGSEVEGLGSGVIIPRKGLAELKRLVDEEDADEVELAFEGSNGLARKGDVTLVMRLIEGEFPNYQQVVPKNIGQRLTLATEPLTHALRRVVLLSAERSRAVRLQLSEGQLTLSSSNPDLGEAQEELDVDYAGPEIAVGFNARYLLDVLGVCHAKEVELGLQDEMSPMQLQPTDDPDTLAIIMPMRL
jgi:DNA polymerase-3 subunit beta